MISTRTKAALTAAKARGHEAGSPKLAKARARPRGTGTDLESQETGGTNDHFGANRLKA
jgi:hypothetical protein